MNCDNGAIEIRKGAVAVAAPPESAHSAICAPNPGKRLKSLPAPKAPPVESEN